MKRSRNQSNDEGFNIASSTIKTITVMFEETILSMDVSEVKGENLIISVEAMDDGKYDVNTAFDDGQKYAGTITLTLPYDSVSGTPVAYYYPDDGSEKVRMDATIDETTHTVTFVTNHNSVYGVEYETTPTPSGSDNQTSLVMAVIVLLAVIAVVGVAVGKDE